MARMPGVPAADAWPGMSLQAKEQLVCEVVCVLAALHEHLFEGIGNLYKGKVGGVEVRRIVPMNFFWHQFCELPVLRGPFRTSHEVPRSTDRAQAWRRRVHTARLGRLGRHRGGGGGQEPRPVAASVAADRLPSHNRICGAHRAVLRRPLMAQRSRR